MRTCLHDFHCECNVDEQRTLDEVFEERLEAAARRRLWAALGEGACLGFLSCAGKA